MKLKNIFLNLFLLIFLVFGQVGSVTANSLGDTPPTINEDKVVIGQSFTLRENQVLNGDLAIIGGTATLKAGSQVTGDVAIIGGVLEIDGRVTGDIQAIGGSVSLNQTAIIEGSLYNFGSNLRQSDGARIEGSQISNLPFDLKFGAIEVPNATFIPFEAAKRTTGFVAGFLWAVLQIIAMGGLAMLVVLIAPKSTDRIATAIGKQPLTHWGIGLLTAFAFPAFILVCIITIILIPLGLIGIMALTAAIIYGWIALGYEIGKRLFVSNNNMSPALIAGIGTVILSVVSRIVGAIPCIGWLLVVTLSLFGLGAIILTRVGTRDYPEAFPAQSSGMYQSVSSDPIAPSNNESVSEIRDIEDIE
ncbi:MAG TPA: polymer-forming cytoskeletal protein [Anaerolineaceae bacterium]|nr:polymer-forming cytoskeletal protein [Anaerolineaceae bacterium]